MSDKAQDICERLRSRPGEALTKTERMMDEAADLIQSQQELIDEMSVALEISKTALNDWLNVYAEDECDQHRVIEAKKRIGEFGTIGYIAEVTEKISVAIAKSDQHK